MNAKFYFQKIIFIIFFLFSAPTFAQQAVPFKMRYKGIVKGDMTVIANNIVNRVDFTNTPNDPYYNLTSYSMLNDEFDMEYIDIDEDDETFSSSSADLYLENSTNKKIVYAGLYWSGTYKYNAGFQKSEKKFMPTDPSRTTFTNVKLKLPNSEKYKDISGQLIFDGANTSDFNDFSPYVVYADITDYLKNSTNASGVYTVANIKATQGKIMGGVAAGWTIFVVYEDLKMSEKFITSFDGFSGISDKPTDIVVNGFQSVAQGAVSAKVAFAALEGDMNLIGDQMLIRANQNANFSPLSSTFRKFNDFFNSSITIENQIFSNRFPDSKNTLGYDTCLQTIPNSNNSIIGNNVNESTLRFKALGDKSYLFFSAFGIEVSTTSQQKNDLVNVDKPLKVSSKNNLIKFIPANKDFLIEDYKTSSSVNLQKKNTFIDNKNNLVEVQTISISGLQSGYFIVANIFKTKQSAIEFVTFLKGKDFEADFFTNPLNNYSYVYLKKSQNINEIIELFLSRLNETYKDRIQILAVNKNNNDLIGDATNNGEIKNSSNDSKNSLFKNGRFDVQIVTIPNEVKGYYLVVNVFENNENPTVFLNSLKAKGHNPKIMVNPLTNYKYVYLKKFDFENDANSMILSKINNTYQDKIWIVSVNNNNSLITNNDD